MREETRERLYHLLERRIAERRGAPSPQSYFELVGLEVANLRRRYANQAPSSDYSDPLVRDAYLLAYVPHYIHTSSGALAEISCNELISLSTPELSITSLGGGPLPEIVAISDRLMRCGAAPVVNILNLDMNAANWAEATTDLKAIAQQIAPGIEFKITNEIYDCSAATAPDDFPKCDILLVQNCINEIANAASLQVILELEKTIRPGGFLIVSDFNEYYGTVSQIEQLEALIDRLGHIRRTKFDKTRVEKSIFAPPAIPRLTYFSLFGYKRDQDTGERGFADFRIPRSHLRFSNSITIKLSM